MEVTDTDVAIVGAGAAGLVAAIFAARAGARVVALERAPRVGAKILISGGGRCNVTHDTVDQTSFYGANRNQIAKVLRSFPVEQTVAFFADLGVPLKREETGKLFPVSDRARDVIDALTKTCYDLGATVELSSSVDQIQKQGDRFHLISGERVWSARSVILAAGGRSVPKTGSDGTAYELAKALGHSVSSTFPALVPLLVPAKHWITSLTGLTLTGRLTLVGTSGRKLQQDQGSLLFTHFGLSGPLILDMSRHWIEARETDPGVSLVLSLAGETADLERAALAGPPGATALSFMRAFVPERLALAIIYNEAGITADRKLSQCTRVERQSLVRGLTAFPLPISGDRGFDYAEVTAGGVPLAEVNVATMESRITPNLYLCGEILDVDGRIGGYNFQWAWASGRLAGVSASS